MKNVKLPCSGNTNSLNGMWFPASPFKLVFRQMSASFFSNELTKIFYQNMWQHYVVLSATHITCQILLKENILSLSVVSVTLRSCKRQFHVKRYCFCSVIQKNLVYLEQNKENAKRIKTGVPYLFFFITHFWCNWSFTTHNLNVLN